MERPHSPPGSRGKQFVAEDESFWKKFDSYVTLKVLSMLEEE